MSTRNFAALCGRRVRSAIVSAIALGAAFTAPAAHASLTLFQQYTGAYGLSTSGFGSTTDSGQIQAFVPVGATVTAAYLYSSTFFGGSASGTLGGSNVNYSAALGVTSTCCTLQAFRADVTSIVAPVVNGGSASPFNFNITETGVNQDGEALVVVYSLPSLPTTTIGVLDGFSATTGDTSSFLFSTPLNPNAPGFQAEMRIGDGFSCCGQDSTITVNGKTLTTVAGNNDDSVDPSLGNGNLITVGGNNDPFTVASPGSPASDYNTDHERYDLTPFINVGDTSIVVNTLNPTNDDNIFLETFQVSGNAVIISNGVPEPSTWAMMIIGFAGVGFMSLRRAKTMPRGRLPQMSASCA